MLPNNLLHSLKKKTVQIIFFLLALLPFAFGAAAAIDHFGSYGRYRTFSIILFFAFFLFLILISSEKIRGLSNEVIIVLLSVLTVLVRQLSVIFFNTLPVSDYGDVINSAIDLMRGPVRSLYSARFPYWGFYSITLSRLFRIFGGSIGTAKTINVITAGLTAVGIYLAGKQIFGSKKYGFLVALIFVFSPSSTLYVNLPSGEHIFVMLLPVVVLLYPTIFKHPEIKIYKKSIISILTGMLLGLMDMYKPVAVILLIGFILSFLLYETDLIKRTSSGKNHKRQILFNGLFIVILIIGFISTKAACFSIIEHQFGYPPNKFGLGWTLRIGLDMEKGGRVNTPIQSYMNNLYRDYDEDYQYVNSLLIQESLELVKGKTPDEVSGFLRDKFVYMWGTNEGFYDWIAYNQVETGLMAYDADRLGLLVKPLADSFLIISSILSAIGAIYCMFNKREKGTLSIGLFILGFTLMLFVSEVQQRYRSVLESSIPFFTVYGLIAVKKAAEYARKFIAKLNIPNLEKE